jgi:hypothetical protein
VAAIAGKVWRSPEFAEVEIPGSVFNGKSIEGEMAARRTHLGVYHGRGELRDGVGLGWAVGGYLRTSVVMSVRPRAPGVSKRAPTAFSSQCETQPTVSNIEEAPSRGCSGGDELVSSAKSKQRQLEGS